jgi:hypothetical protein
VRVTPQVGQCQSVRVLPFIVSMLLLVTACDTPVS